MRFFRDLSLSAFTAGFVAVLVGFTSSVAIVFQAAQAFKASPELITSWMWALGLGMGLCSAIPSLILRQPVMVAWSTPGAAVLATAGLAGGFSMAEAVGAQFADNVSQSRPGEVGHPSSAVLPARVPWPHALVTSSQREDQETPRTREQPG